MEECVTATAKRTGRRTNKHQQLVQALSTPIAALWLSARPMTALRALSTRYAYELVTLEPTDLRRQRNFGETSLREVNEKLATRGLTLGVPLEEDAYRAAVVAAVAAKIRAGTRGVSGMGTEPERRRVMRVDVPRHFRGGDLQPHFVHLLDLSRLGVRVAHLDPWPEGVVCAVELPPALGALRLPGQVVWTRLRGTEGNLGEDRRSRYESGVEFTRLTAEQQAALALALATFRAAQAPPHREPSP